MDFLDPLYARRHAIRLYTGYGLVAIAIFLAVTMLLLIAYGFQISKDGQVIQNGLLFASSKPTGATLYIDGVAVDKQTNTRLNIPEGSYQLELKRDGYREWQHRIEIVGGRVFRYDYPLLIPETLNTTAVQKLGATAPGIVTQTPDHRRLLLQQQPQTPSFLVFDLKNPKVAPLPLTLPADKYTKGGAQSWHVVEWSRDNVHLMLKHGYGAKQTEYILLDRETPADSLNVSALFKTQATPAMIESKFDQYYLYSTSDRILRRASLSEPTPTVVLQNVLEYEPFKATTVLYVTPDTEDATQSVVHLKVAERDYVLRRVAKAARYHVAINNYSGDDYIAIADSTREVVYIYRNPLVHLTAGLKAPATVALKITDPSFLRFSAGGRFILAERGTSFVAYDAEYKQTARYTLTQPIDKGQAHAVWLDGAHLQYVSNQQLYLFDYDGTNTQLLVPATSGSQVFYNSDYSVMYAVAPPTATDGTYTLTGTALRTPADQ